ncbi:hypothetical protein ACVIQY_003110 [Bradyrhizobium sp. USDA 3051]
MGQSRDPAFAPLRRERDRAQSHQRQGDLSADRAVDRRALVFRCPLPLPRIQFRFRHLSRQRGNAPSRDDARSERTRSVCHVRGRRRGRLQNREFCRRSRLGDRADSVPTRSVQRLRLSRQGLQFALSLWRFDAVWPARGEGRQIRPRSRVRFEPRRFPARHRGDPACDDVAGFLDHPRRQPAIRKPRRAGGRRGVDDRSHAAGAQQARRQSAARGGRHQRAEDQGRGLAVSAAERPERYRTSRRRHRRRPHARGAVGPHRTDRRCLPDHEAAGGPRAIAAAAGRRCDAGNDDIGQYAARHQ